ncbi:hypothetical protein QZH56_13870 [Streptomyces olivoreticuli]|uniref:hypothetical protein n=1 Tax=Streptomyces olivoreticuli TaxID=68246 RepID=UPI00265A2118|nr:hypothetical protein [Streptomyces olivoreticuli]WKK26579.1 hypothetical protein QZH56_13870 [Streptomyces olivoreticuli]
MYAADPWPVIIGALVLTLSVLGLALLVMWWATPNPHRGLLPPPVDAPGARYRCWCHNEPTEVLVVPPDAVVVLSSGRHARPSRLATLRHRIRPAPPGHEGAGGTGKGKPPAPVLTL